MRQESWVEHASLGLEVHELEAYKEKSYEDYGQTPNHNRRGFENQATKMFNSSHYLPS